MKEKLQKVQNESNALQKEIDHVTMLNKNYSEQIHKMEEEMEDRENQLKKL